MPFGCTVLSGGVFPGCCNTLNVIANKPEKEWSESVKLYLIFTDQTSLYAVSIVQTVYLPNSCRWHVILTLLASLASRQTRKPKENIEKKGKWDTCVLCYNVGHSKCVFRDKVFHHSCDQKGLLSVVC